MRMLLVLIAIILLIGVVSADTLIIYPTDDARLRRIGVNQNFIGICNGIGTERGNLGYSSIYSTATGANFSELSRNFASFNLSFVPINSIINSANYSLMQSDSNSGLGKPSYLIINASPANPYSMVASDYNKFNLILLSNNITHDTISADGAAIRYTNFVLNTAGLLYIKNNIGGSITLVSTSNWVFDRNFGGTYVNGTKTSYKTWYQSEEAGTDKDPVLTIVYTPPDTTPPASITGLSNSTATCQAINWTWTNPGDADYNGLMVLKNGTFFHNLSAAATSDLWLNLPELTEYTFSSKTFDALNNTNTTFVNRTSITSKCPPGPLASFASNVTCGLVPFRVQFNDTSYSSTNLTGWNWSFGDGNYSITQNPVFEYNLSGMFAVSLNATNAWGSNISQTLNYIRGVPNWASCPPTPTPTPTWQPEINPSTEMDLQPNWWWLIAGGMILFIWLIFRRSR